MTMFESGFIDLGYTIFKKRLFKLRFKEPIAIGAYNLTFNRKTMYICKAATLCQGYFLRRKNWG